MKCFEVGKRYGSRDKRNGTMKVLQRTGRNEIIAEFTERDTWTCVLYAYVDYDGNEGASVNGARNSGVDYSAAIPLD